MDDLETRKKRYNELLKDFSDKVGATVEFETFKALHTDLFDFCLAEGQLTASLIRQAHITPDGKMVLPGDPDYPPPPDYTVTMSGGIGNSKTVSVKHNPDGTISYEEVEDDGK